MAVGVLQEILLLQDNLSNVKFISLNLSFLYGGGGGVGKIASDQLNKVLQDLSSKQNAFQCPAAVLVSVPHLSESDVKCSPR